MEQVIDLIQRLINECDNGVDARIDEQYLHAYQNGLKHALSIIEDYYDYNNIITMNNDGKEVYL